MNLWKDHKQQFEDKLKGYFRSVKNSKSLEKRFSLVIIWMGHAAAAVSANDYTQGILAAKEARNWIDEYIDAINIDNQPSKGEKRIKKMPKCEQCHFSGEPSEFEMCLSPYHDLRCPKCETTAVDTSDINSDQYGYGDDNFLSMPETPQRSGKI